MVSISIKIVLWLIASTSVSHCELFKCQHSMMMYSLAVVHGMPCMPSLSLLLNSMGALFILTYAAIHAFYCHYMLTPFVECLWYIRMLNFDTLFEGKKISQ